MLGAGCRNGVYGFYLFQPLVASYLSRHFTVYPHWIFGSIGHVKCRKDKRNIPSRVGSTPSEHTYCALFFFFFNLILELLQKWWP
jgi:hypothetical protein